MGSDVKPLLLDTCALLWWTLAPEQLSARAHKACTAIDTSGGLVSSISIWEIGNKVAHGKLGLGAPFSEYVARVRSLSMLEILPVTLSVWLGSFELQWEHRDPADRVIVATAAQLGARLVTKDDRIRAHYRRCVW